MRTNAGQTCVRLARVPQSLSSSGIRVPVPVHTEPTDRQQSIYASKREICVYGRVSRKIRICPASNLRCWHPFCRLSSVFRSSSHTFLMSYYQWLGRRCHFSLPSAFCRSFIVFPLSLPPLDRSPPRLSTSYPALFSYWNQLLRFASHPTRSHTHFYYRRITSDKK